MTNILLESREDSYDTDAYGVSGERVNSWDLFREEELLSEKYGDDNE